MKLHDNKTEQEQRQILTRLTQFVYKGFQTSLSVQICNLVNAKLISCKNHTKDLQVKQLSHIVVSNQNSLVMIQILFPISTGKTDLSCCLNYFRKRPVLLLPLLHAIKNCSRSHAQILLMWYVFQRLFSCVFYYQQRHLSKWWIKNCTSILSRFEWIWGDDASYNISESKVKKSLVKVQISSCCRENLCSV